MFYHCLNFGLQRTKTWFEHTFQKIYEIHFLQKSQEFKKWLEIQAIKKLSNIVDFIQKNFFQHFSFKFKRVRLRKREKGRMCVLRGLVVVHRLGPREVRCSNSALGNSFSGLPSTNFGKISVYLEKESTPAK